MELISRSRFYLLVCVFIWDELMADVRLWRPLDLPPFYWFNRFTLSSTPVNQHWRLSSGEQSTTRSSSKLSSCRLISLLINLNSWLDQAISFQPSTLWTCTSGSPFLIRLSNWPLGSTRSLLSKLPNMPVQTSSNSPRALWWPVCFTPVYKLWTNSIWMLISNSVVLTRYVLGFTCFTLIALDLTG